MSSPSQELSFLNYVRGLEERLRRIEDRLDDFKPKKKDSWDRFQSVAPFLSAMIILLVGVFVTDRIEHVLKERQLQLLNAKEMQGFLTQLVDGKTPMEEARSSSLTMAAYGRYAVAPLIQVMQTNPQNREAAMEGLRAAGAMDLEAVCAQLTNVINNRTKLYHFEVHQSAAQLLGDLNCQKAVPDLKRYSERLQSVSKVKAPFTAVPGSQDLSEENIETVRTKVKEALTALELQNIS